jgi:DNA-binding beta-propeller fold protein YncE
MVRAKFATLILLAAAAVFAGASQTASAADPQYKFEKEILIGGGSGWDYLYADSVGRRLYVSHGTKVVIIDMDADKIIGEIVDTPGVHGIAVAPDLGHVFVSNGQENKSSIVDIITLKTIMKVPTGSNPDAIFFEPVSGEVWTFNGRSHDATAYDGKTGAVVAASIPLDCKPETGVADAAMNRVFVNQEDKNAVAEIDLKAHKLITTWPIAPGESATGMAMDHELHRLIIGGSNSKMIMMNADTGAIVSTVDCGQGVDAAAFDPGTHLGFVSGGGSGTVTVARVEADKLTVIQTLTTERGARTMTVDKKTHRIFLSNAKSRTDANSFKVLIYALTGN